MAEFNIKDSKIEQLTNSGDNYMVVGHGASREEKAAKEEGTSVPLGAGITKRIFVVHGHDEEMKQAVARTVLSLGLSPVILHEQPNEGKTVIEKFEKHADVDFAIVLLSPDDVAYSKAGSARSAKPRARQNVILELGYFVGKLGRAKVFPLYRGGSNLELPSDIAGVLYNVYDAQAQWRLDLVRELKAAGYDVDANKLICQLGRFAGHPSIGRLCVQAFRDTTIDRPVIE